MSDGNWIQTDPSKGWNTILHLYSPLESFFTKKWRLRSCALQPARIVLYKGMPPNEIELVK